MTGTADPALAAEATAREALAGLVERVTFHHRDASDAEAQVVKWPFSLYEP